MHHASLPPLNLDDLRVRWRERGGYRDIFWIAGPLILSTSSLTIQQFIDRLFLSWHSEAEFAASLPASWFSFVIIGFFMGTAGYANAFVAQYNGAGRPDRVGAAVWQAVYFSIAAGVIIIAAIPLTSRVLVWADHPPDVLAHELTYFRITCYTGGFITLSSAVSALYTGLGRTWTVLLVNVASTLVNIVLDYAMIFGHWGFPEWGIAGAAWATFVSAAVNSAVYLVLFLNAYNRRRYATGRRWRLEWALLKRLLRFGAPSGGQIMIDILSFAAFTLLVGRLGMTELTATNLAFQINMIAFMPMIGLGIAVTTLVGQHLGENHPERAARATWAAFHVAFCYMGLCALLFVLIPNVFIRWFAGEAPAAEFLQVSRVAVVLLRFVAAYCLFDVMVIIFSSALKGAGDTRFVLLVQLTLAWTIMVIPTWLFIERGWGGVYWAWIFATTFVNVAGLVMLRRFLKNHWVTMRVIETAPAPV
ncbi:MAG TPA: MATE family efflux transporter [Candidatus Sumerlaeota bacterium]|mgnify:CR=1 FL=1|nr:MATE family efflux transporter [Candidatus Sumerlaeota bacterium]HOR27332.1 MATE family efflux transporter [Candidatus Sumerlaeota bacterium]